VRDLIGREAPEALKGYGFSDADIAYVYEKSEQFRNAMKGGEEQVLNQVQLAYEIGAFIGIARGKRFPAPKTIGFQP
jgi:hypothetical protein